MSLDTGTRRRALPLAALALGAVALLLPPAAAASPGHASFSIGFGHHHGGYFYFGHYRPYVFYRPYAHWRYVPAGYPASYRDLGAVQLKVSPKKTDVYVDGQYVGRSGKFDGFPDYLWLERGEHTLAFYRQGFRTVAERIRVRPGMITELRLEMEPGESVPPSELDREPAASPPTSPVAPAAPRPAPRPEPEPDRVLDLRADGGRVRLDIEPVDASVYLDGRFLGTGSDLRRLHGGMVIDTGQHTLDVLHPRYRAERISFRVEAGEDLEVRVTLDEGRAETE